MGGTGFNATLITSLAVLLLAGESAAQFTTRPAAPSAPGAAAAAVAEVRTATERFRDVNVALAEGYIPDPTGMCITAPMEGQPRQLGAMGIHYFRPDLLGITATAPRVDGTGTHTDFSTPGVLIYEPQPSGPPQLVAVENVVFQKAWKEAGHAEPPIYLGNEYYSMADNPLTEIDEAHGFEPHYELHFWIYRENPNGEFAPFNPRASCEHGSHAGK